MILGSWHGGQESRVDEVRLRVDGTIRGAKGGESQSKVIDINGPYPIDQLRTK